MALDHFFYTLNAPGSMLAWRVGIKGECALLLALCKGDEVLLRLTVGIGFQSRVVKFSSPQISTSKELLDIPTQGYTKRARITLETTSARLDFGDVRLHLFASAQGLAYRWESCFKGCVRLTEEKFEVETPLVTEFLYAYHNHPHREDPFQNSWESIHHLSGWEGITDERLIYLPMTCLTPKGAIAITETELRNAPGLNLQKVKGKKRFCALQAPAPAETDASNRRYAFVTKRHNYLVETQGERLYPWRVFMFGETPAALYDNDLPYVLSVPAEGDFSWVKTGRVAWDWWNAWGLEGVSFTPGVNTQTYKYFIDFAEAFHIPYVILDEGWACDLDITRIVPEIDLPEILRYAAAHHVRIILWSSWPQLIDRQEDIFRHYAAMGVAGFKIDFFDRDDCAIAEMLYTTAGVAAKYHLVIAYHGIHKPTGLSRTYPNVLTYEGVFGLENTKWTSREVDFPKNDVRLAFARLLAGPMDYTPGAMKNRHRETFEAIFKSPMSMGTRAHQAALFVLYDTGLQMLCDAPTAYEKEPEYTRFLCKIPLLWESTRALPYSHPNQMLAVHRVSGEVHTFAAITDDTKRLAVFPLDQLPHRTYRATILRDVPSTAFCADHYVLETQEVMPPHAIEIPCARGGGCVVRLEPC